jgi:hypothetical protein
MLYYWSGYQETKQELQLWLEFTPILRQVTEIGWTVAISERNLRLQFKLAVAEVANF